MVSKPLVKVCNKLKFKHPGLKSRLFLEEKRIVKAKDVFNRLEFNNINDKHIYNTIRILISMKNNYNENRPQTRFKIKKEPIRCTGFGNNRKEIHPGC